MIIIHNVKFVREPGYIYDLFFLFILNFNQDYCLNNLINHNKYREETEFYTKLLMEFDPISDDLFLFFYMKESNKAFITQYYFEPYKLSFTSTYNFAMVQTELMNHDKVIRNLFMYYFSNEKEQSLAEYMSTSSSIVKVIKNSDYSDRVKNSLYSFFLDPLPIIQKLLYELMTKEFQLSQLYEKSFRKITELQQNLDIAYVLDKLKQCENAKCNLDDFDEIYFTFCILFKNCIMKWLLNDFGVVAFGIDYQEQFEYLVNQKQIPSLDVFGNAISESNRVNILNLIFDRNEVTIKDIEQELKFTGTNAYYHLSLMLKANLIRTRNQGRTIYYALNRQHFDVICKTLSKYSNISQKEDGVNQ